MQNARLDVAVCLSSQRRHGIVSKPSLRVPASHASRGRSCSDVCSPPYITGQDPGMSARLMRAACMTHMHLTPHTHAVNGYYESGSSRHKAQKFNTQLNSRPHRGSRDTHGACVQGCGRMHQSGGRSHLQGDNVPLVPALTNRHNLPRVQTQCDA